MTLEQITEIFGRHYTQALKDGGKNPERVLRLFTQAVIDDLKRIPAAPPRVAMRSDE